MFMFVQDIVYRTCLYTAQISGHTVQLNAQTLTTVPRPGGLGQAGFRVSLSQKGAFHPLAVL